MITRWAEYLGVRLLLVLTTALPYAVLYPVAIFLADVAFFFLPRRRRLARSNLTHALGASYEPKQISQLARASCRSFVLTALPEVVKLRIPLTGPHARQWLEREVPDASSLFERARAIHEASGGCIFVTPHLGNWELLPYTAAAVGIPLAVAVRPLDNPLVEDLLRRAREKTGHVFLNRGQAMASLKLHLRRGRSLALLADQATMKGLPVPFFGRTALTTPIPALLAVHSHRPIVILASVRTGRLRYKGLLSDPLWPTEGADEREEVERLTREINRVMEQFIRLHPEQYLWMHDRWKTYD